MYRHKTTYYLFFLITLLIGAGCSEDVVVHELRGKTRAPWFEPVPYGMSYIQQGTFKIGVSDDNIDQALVPIRNLSVQSFWMDETEITNNEYRQYLRWVSDSVAATLTFKAGIEYYMATGRNNQILEPPVVDRLKISDIWTDQREDVAEALQPIFYQGDESFYGPREVDYRNISYSYAYIDLEKAAKRANSYNYATQSYDGGIQSRQDFIVKKEVPVYPDTLVWIRDFTYSYNEPWTLKYFHHPAFYEYPVVGVTWEQANAFCHWRTEQKKNFLGRHGILPVHSYRLPTEAEWEYAASGGRLNAKYPWGGYYTLNDKGCYLANFKPKRGNYIADSYTSAKTMKVGTFDPNDFGLYDMAGNVAEWTSTAFDPAGYELMHDMNPEYRYDADSGDPPAMKRKVVRGGSWKDVAYYLEVSTRDFEYQDSASSYVGFRCVMNAIEDERKAYE
jgi:gliding motility-associated lipoprotein GldK